jgi:hypothetical protein
LEMLVSQGAESEKKVRFYDAAELPSLAGCCREAAEICYGKPPRVKLTYDGHDFSAHFKEAELSLGRMTREEVAQAYPEVRGAVPPQRDSFFTATGDQRDDGSGFPKGGDR